MNIKELKTITASVLLNSDDEKLKDFINRVQFFRQELELAKTNKTIKSLRLPVIKVGESDEFKLFLDVIDRVFRKKNNSELLLVGNVTTFSLAEQKMRDNYFTMFQSLSSIIPMRDVTIALGNGAREYKIFQAIKKAHPGMSFSVAQPYKEMNKNINNEKPFGSRTSPLSEEELFEIS